MAVSYEKYGPWALIIGGSEGVGASFARRLAAEGYSIVLVARKQAPLDELADELRAGGTEVRTLSVDMALSDALEKVRSVTDDIEVGFLIYNAGANKVRGNFLELDAADYRALMAINIMGQVEFTRHYGALMKDRGRGGIILTGSTASYLGSATLATYCGVKAFSRLWGEALWAECAPMGIDVLHLVINFTATPYMARAGYDISKAQSPDEVADEALANLGKVPVHIMGGEPALEMMKRRSQFENRGDLIATIATPRREDLTSSEGG